MYFHRTSVSEEEQGKDTLDYHSQHSSNLQESSTVENGETKHCFMVSGTRVLRKIRNAYALLWKHFIQAYTNYRVAKWSVWWALATCGYLQVVSYIQLLWQTAVMPGDMIYNGAVDFVYAIVGKEDASAIFDKTCALFNFVKSKYPVKTTNQCRTISYINVIDAG